MKTIWEMKSLAGGIFAGLLVLSSVSCAGDGVTSEAAAKPEVMADTKEEVSALRSGEEVYKSVCMACHVAEGMPTVGPPIFAVKNHVIGAHPERDDFVNRVVEWVKAPDEKTALMPGAVRKFGLMPANDLPDEELKAVAEFIYDSDMSLPDWYKEHYQAEHGEMPKE